MNPFRPRSRHHHHHHEPDPIVVTLKCEYCGNANSLSKPQIPLWWSQYRVARCDKCGRRLARAGPLGYAALLVRYEFALIREAPRFAWHGLRRLRRSARHLAGSP